MKPLIYKTLNVTGSLVLVSVLILVIWQPVIPSNLIINKMSESIDPETLTLKQQAVIRFVLNGKGGGIYSLKAEKGKVSVIKGKTNKVDLIIYMDAMNFNTLVFSLAQGKADVYTFKKLIISNHLRFAGDMNVFQKIFNGRGES